MAHRREERDEPSQSYYVMQSKTTNYVENFKSRFKNESNMYV